MRRGSLPLRSRTAVFGVNLHRLSMPFFAPRQASMDRGTTADKRFPSGLMKMRVWSSGCRDCSAKAGETNLLLQHPAAAEPGKGGTILSRLATRVKLWMRLGWRSLVLPPPPGFCHLGFRYRQRLLPGFIQVTRQWWASTTGRGIISGVWLTGKAEQPVA